MGCVNESMTRHFAQGFTIARLSNVFFMGIIFSIFCAGSGQSEQESAHSRYYVLLSGQHVATVQERYDAQTRNVVRANTLVHLPSEKSQLKGKLDHHGFVLEAEYKRSGQQGQRHVKLARGNSSFVSITDVLTGQQKSFSGRPVVFLETLHLMKPRQGLVEVDVIDIVTAESLPARLVFAEGKPVLSTHQGVLLAKGGFGDIVRVGPGAFVESRRQEAGGTSLFEMAPSAEDALIDWGDTLSLGGLVLPGVVFALDGPGQKRKESGHRKVTVQWNKTVSYQVPPLASHRQPAIFLESDDPTIKEFADTHGGEDVWQDALQIAAAIHQQTDTRKGGGPPSAVGTLRRKAGDCDDATALLVAALRARGHAARPVVGYEQSSGRFVPHAWAEVWNGEEWLMVDPLRPGIGPFPSHLKLFEGLGSPLTMGRVIGTWAPQKGPN